MEAKNIEEAAKIIYGDYKKQYFEQFFLLPVWDDTPSPVKDKYLETAERVCQSFEAEISFKAGYEKGFADAKDISTQQAYEAGVDKGRQNESI